MEGLRRILGGKAHPGACLERVHSIAWIDIPAPLGKIETPESEQPSASEPVQKGQIAQPSPLML
jgi:hypothetical protein